MNDKQLSHKLHYLTFGWALQLCSLPIVTVALLVSKEFFNPLSLGSHFWLPTVLLWVGFYPLSTFLYVTAMKHGELSKILPLQSFGPIFSLLLAWLLLSQRPSLQALLGILVVVLGAYTLNLKETYLHNPLEILRDKANLYILLNLLLVAGAGVLNAIAIKASGPAYYSFVSTLGAIPLLYGLARACGVREGAAVRQHRRSLSIAGGCFGASFVTNMVAISLGPLAYVSTVRGSSAVMGALLGILHLSEALTKPKIAALVLITAGSIVIGLA